MNEEEAKKIIDNMSEQELNDFIFFALQEVEKENQKLKAEIEKKDKIINQIKKENHDLKEKLQMFIPRRRVRRVYKMLGKILSVDIDPIILEKELKAEYKIKEDK